jgi:hypothetical protein
MPERDSLFYYNLNLTIMATKAFWSVFAVIAALTMTLAASAYMGKKEHIPSRPDSSMIGDTFFQYTGPDESDAELKDADNWIEVGATRPSTNPCTNGTNLVCVSHLANATLAMQSGATNIERFVNYLTLPSVDASDYIQANSDYQKQ